MNRSKKRNLFLAIAVTILVPLSFFIKAQLEGKGDIPMPRYYVPEKITGRQVDGKLVNDTIFHRTSDLKLVNQLGETVSLNGDLEGKILVVNFIYTSCPTICPKLTGNMKLLQRAFRKDRKKEVTLNDKVQLLSITVDPERDTFQQLRRFAERFGVNHDKWYFLTGDKQQIYDFARNELRLSLQPGDGGADDFIHTQKLVVIDEQRYIRGYYDGLDSMALDQCAYDISLLTREKKKK